MSATQLIPYSRREGSKVRTDFNWVCMVTDAEKRPPNLSVLVFLLLDLAVPVKKINSPSSIKKYPRRQYFFHFHVADL